MADGPSSTIVFDGNSTGAVAALHAVDVAAKQTAAAVQGTGAALGKVGDSAGAGLGKAEAATRRFESQIKRLNLELESGGRDTRAYIEGRAKAAGADPATLAPLLAQYDQLKAKQALANAEFTKAGKVMTDYGMGVKATSAALRQVPAQFTDIIVSLQGGQAPLTVLLQQGGQLKDVFGGVGNAFKALSRYIIGLINPVTLGIAAVGTLAYSFISGAKEAEAYNKALILTGNAAGATASQLGAMAVAVSQSTGGTIGAAADALQQLAGAGNIVQAQFKQIAAVATEFQRVSGTAVSETVKQFAELGKEPVKASEKLNETTHYLTAAIYEQIKALEDQGDKLGAAALAQSAWADALENRIPALRENLGLLESSWRSIIGTAKSAWDAMLDVGRTSSTADQIRKLQSQISDTQKNLGYNPGLYGADLKNMQAKLIYLQRIQASEGSMAVYQADKIRREESSIELAKKADKYATRQVQLQRELAQAQTALANSNKTPQDYANYQKTVVGITDKFKEPDAKKTPKGPANLDPYNIAKGQLALDLADIKAFSDKIVNAYANGEKTMEALRSAGLMDERDYYAAKKSFLMLNGQAQEDELTKEIIRLEQEKLAGKDQIDNLRKIAETQAKLDKVRANSATSLNILSIQEESAGKKLAQSYRDAEDAAKSYLDTIRQAQMRDLLGAGLGNAERNRIDGRAQIEDKYSGQRQELEKSRRDAEFSGTFGIDAQAKYNDELERIRRYSATALTEYDAYYAKRREQENNWAIGASEAMANYVAESRDIAGQTERAFSNAFQGMEDALVTFITTGKLSFTDLANSIVADITRIIIKQQIANAAIAMMGGSSGGGMLGSLMGSLLGSSAGSYDPLTSVVGHAATGGPVAARSITNVNERGPELLNVAGKQYLMMGNQAGSVTPNSGVGGNTVNMTLHQHFAAGTTKQTTLQAAADASRQLQYAGRNL